MNPRRYALVLSIAFALLFLASNVLVGVVTRGWRLDVTQDRLYSLSPGAKRILKGLAEPVDLTFYYSREAAAKYPAVRTYAARVRELLQSYAGRANGRVRVTEIEPVRYTEVEDAAVAAGIQPVTPEQGAEPIYFGIVGSNAVAERVSIASLDASREPFLEYEITRVISELETPRHLKVAMITSLPFDPASGTPDAPAQQPLFFSELKRAADVEMLPQDFTAIPEDADVLALIQPWPMSQAQLYAVDQFMMAKGRAFIAVDPAAVAWNPGLSPFGPSVEVSADLNGLMRNWGVSTSRSIVLDLERAIEVMSTDAMGQQVQVQQPMLIAVPANQMSREDLATASLPRALYMPAPGGITWTNVDGVVVSPLAWTTKTTMRVPAEQILMGGGAPADLIRNFVPAGKKETLAARVSGVLGSAFGPMRPSALGASPVKHLAKSAHPADVVIVSDADFLNDEFYVSPENRTPFVDNGAFALNTIDLLGGSDALVSLRSRAPSLRPLEAVDKLREAAQAKLSERQSALMQELAATESRLKQLENKGRGSGFFAGELGAELTAEERDEIESFRTRVMQVRADLRAVEREYRADLDRLEGWLILLNVWMMPLLVALAGLFVFWRRSVRRDALLPKLPPVEEDDHA